MFVVLKGLALLPLKAIGYPVMIPLWVLYHTVRLTAKAVRHPLKALKNVALFPLTATAWIVKGAYRIVADTMKDWRSFLLMPFAWYTSVRVANNRRPKPDEPSIAFNVVSTGLPMFAAVYVIQNLKQVESLIQSLMTNPELAKMVTTLPVWQQVVAGLVGCQALSLVFELGRYCLQSVTGSKAQAVRKQAEMETGAKLAMSPRPPYDYLTMFNRITDRDHLTDVEAKQMTAEAAALLASGVITEKEFDEFRKRINDRLPIQAVGV